MLRLVASQEADVTGAWAKNLLDHELRKLYVEIRLDQEVVQTMELVVHDGALLWNREFLLYV